MSSKICRTKRPCTVTLPHRIIRQLEALDSDSSKAIVKCVDGVTATSLSNDKSFEILKISETPV